MTINAAIKDGICCTPKGLVAVIAESIRDGQQKPKDVRHNFVLSNPPFGAQPE